MSVSPPPNQPNQPNQPVLPVHGPQATQMAPPAGHGAVLLTLQGNAFTAGVTPAVHLDGYRVPGAFGPNLYPLRPGRHRMDVHTQWMRRYGQAVMEVDLAEGQVVPAHYAVPWHQFTTGSIGHEKQKRKGLGVMIAIIVVILAVVLLCGVGPAVLG